MSMVTSTDGGLTWGSRPLGGLLVGPRRPAGGPAERERRRAVHEQLAARESSFRSTDGGTSCGPLASSRTSRSTAWPTNIRTFSLPSAEVAGVGRVYLAWQDCRLPRRTAARTTSSTAPRWTASTLVGRHADPDRPCQEPVDHFLPGIAVDKNTCGSSTHLAVDLLLLPDRGLQHEHLRDDRRLHVVPRRRRELDAGIQDRRPDSRSRGSRTRIRATWSATTSRPRSRATARRTRSSRSPRLRTRA